MCPVKYAGNQEFLSHKTFPTRCTQANKLRTMGTEKRTFDTRSCAIRLRPKVTIR